MVRQKRAGRDRRAPHYPTPPTTSRKPRGQRALDERNRWRGPACLDFCYSTLTTRPVPKNPVVLVVLDGWGYRPEREGNAIALANVPTWERLVSRYPRTLLD